MTPKIRLLKTDINGKTKLYTTTKKMKVWSNLVRDLTSEWKLEVEYQPGLKNSGTYKRLSDVRDALSAFTEKQLLEYIYGGEWK